MLKAPMTTNKEKVLQDFYTDLDESVSKNTKKALSFNRYGDFNAKVGKRKVNEDIMLWKKGKKWKRKYLQSSLQQTRFT